MKLTTLLIQFLTANHRLDLPGIGSFTLDPAILSQAADPKNRAPIREGIHFKNNPQLRESPELISFISEQTGKMRSLAASDLESKIELALQFLNIGKPFNFEGLGTLQKKMNGEMAFQPEFILPPAVTGPSTMEDRTLKPAETTYSGFLQSEPAHSGAVRKPLAAALIVGGIALAVVAGYFIARPDQPLENFAAATQVDLQEPVITPGTAETTTAVPVETPPAAAADTSTQAAAADTTQLTTPPVITAAPVSNNGSAYKYILEVAQSKRAFKRYNQLRTNLWQVQMETKDSLQFKLFLMIPTMHSDTTRVLDSLMVMTGRRVYIEHQN